MSTEEQIRYHDNVHKRFSEAVYQKMMQERYGVEFSCDPGLEKWSLRRRLEKWGLKFNILSFLEQKHDSEEEVCLKLGIGFMVIGGNDCDIFTVS